MAYGQKNYNEVIGTGSNYRINQIGCFLTAFCNLMERFGQELDPLALNAEFRNRGLYLNVGDGAGVLDGLGWGSISGVFPDVHVTQVVDHGQDRSAGWPPSNNAIVKFWFKSPHTGEWTTHFCLYAGNGQIVDSWDGVIRAPGYYGDPVAYAVYDIAQPQPIAPVVPPPAPQPSRFEDIAAVDLVVNKQPTEVWDLSAQTWSDFKTLPKQDMNQGDHFQAAAIYHHPLGGNYYVHNNGDLHGINTVDADPAPPPAPVEPPAPAVVEPAVTATEPVKPPETNVSVTTPPDYKNSFTAHSQNFVASEDVVVKDFDGLQKDLQLIAGQKVHGAGVFVKDDIAYVRTQKMIDNNWWYGIPTTALKADESKVGPLLQDVKAAKPPADDSDLDDLFNLDMIKEAKELLHNLSTREKIVINVAKIQGYFLRFVNFINVFRKLKKQQGSK